MDAEEFKRAGKELIDYAVNYMENIRNRKPLSQVKPGYLEEKLPESAPEEGEKWDDIFGDIEKVIMPGVTHWQSPFFHAYYPISSSYPSICADILSDTIGCSGFSWIASPACTELEILMMKWLGKMLNLPKEFYEGEIGGGVIQGTASDATLVSLLAARSKKLKEFPNDTNSSSLVIYCSDQAHSSIEKAAMIMLVKCRIIKSDEKYRMDPKALRDAITEDINNGFIPFCCVATLGTTSVCSFDDLMDIGPICNEMNIWLHIDAAYAGSAFICPEFRHLLNGVEFADSFNFNPHKWLRIHIDCSALWLKNSCHLESAFNVDPLYLQHKNDNKVRDYRHWQIPLGRRFRSLKMWFVFRSFGVQGLQNLIRKDVSLAKEFEKLVNSSKYFEVINEVIMGLVCFRMKGSNDKNELLLEKLTEDGRIFLVPAQIRDVYFLRFVICGPSTTKEDVIFSWNVIQEISKPILHESDQKLQE